MNDMNPYEASSTPNVPTQANHRSDTEETAQRKLRWALFICLFPVMTFTAISGWAFAGEIYFFSKYREPQLLDDYDGAEDRMRELERAENLRFMLMNAFCLSGTVISSSYFAWTLMRYRGMLSSIAGGREYPNAVITVTQAACWKAGAIAAILHIVFSLRNSYAFMLLVQTLWGNPL